MKTATRIVTIILFVTISGFTVLFAQADTTLREMKPPKLINKPELTFPNEAYKGRVVGQVWLRILVGPDGIPIKTDILKRDPEMAYLFDDEARRWGMQCRFSPAMDSNGKSVPMWEVIPISFKLDHFTPPQCTNQVEPNYPEDGLAMGMEGWVGLAVFVKADGDVDGAQILVVAREPQNTTVFDIAAKEAAYHSQYKAASNDGNPVDGWCFIKVPFKIPLRVSGGPEEKQ